MSDKIKESLQVALELIDMQKILINRQNELLEAFTKRNLECVNVGNELSRENHKLRKELDGYKRGKWWTMISSILPTVTFDDHGRRL